MARKVLEGARGPVRDIVCLNAAAALVAAGREGVRGLGAAYERACAAIDSGGAASLLDCWAAATRS
ncbi:hypothetical protein AB0B45_12610 [Nonomuraea sp. NPDC049152]|uniref:hypothetical protein n=1 Tax=Nonomuraea sp. NPDC049152 TaxID=3154350 RepID=UPI0034008037